MPVEARYYVPPLTSRGRDPLTLTTIVLRAVACAEDLPLFVALPRGCLADAKQLLGEHGVTLAVGDQRHDGAPLERSATSARAISRKRAR